MSQGFPGQPPAGAPPPWEHVPQQPQQPVAPQPQTQQWGQPAPVAPQTQQWGQPVAPVAPQTQQWGQPAPFAPAPVAPQANPFAPPAQQWGQPAQFAPVAPQPQTQQWSPVPTQTYGAPPAPNPFAPQGYGAPPAMPGYGAPPPAPGYAMPGAFAGVGDANVFTKSAYFPLGQFIVNLEEIKGVVSRDPKRLGHVMIVVECTVVHTNAPGAVPGNRYAQVFDMNGYGKADMKALLTALAGGQPGNKEHEAALLAQGAYSEAKILEVIGPTQPMRNRKLMLATVFKPNSKPELAAQGKGFTNHNWSPPPAGV